MLVTFIAPIADMLFRSVENQIVSDTLPRTTPELANWDSSAGELPPAETLEALYKDIFIATERKLHTRLGSRLNYELTGVSSLFRKSGRKGEDMGEVYQDQFEDLNKFWKKGENWSQVMGSDAWNAAMAGWDDKSDTPQPPFEARSEITAMLPETATQVRAHLSCRKPKPPLLNLSSSTTRPPLRTWTRTGTTLRSGRQSRPTARISPAVTS